MSQLRFDHLCYLQIQRARAGRMVDEYKRLSSLSDAHRSHLYELKDIVKSIEKQLVSHG